MSQLTFKYRLSRSNDHQEIKKIFSAIYLHFKSEQKAAYFNWPEPAVDTLFLMYKFAVVCDDTSKAIGFICFRNVASDVEIIALGVHPSLQKSGGMSGLFQYFIDNLCSRDATVFLEVHEKNQPAIQFYQKFGFKTDGLRKSYYLDGASALNMSRAVL